MNFKEIQLVGFKSFADKTTVRFEDGVTCIVGPNGCGKSNVADAVRWVLGEQSAKTLRGSSMQDVIFGGTETRRQLSFCEVTLVFDNSEKIFDIEYEEVAMTRRLYRSGASEYLINKQPCRMRDITALLHGVGIGKEGYSIIGQGKVAQIMNSKPEERRAIFEEATGVIKFKAQKGEIERKLESAKDNLLVFVQRMAEAENQLRPLEKQAETARKYRELSGQLKYEEINAYLIRSDTFEQETAKYRARISEAEKTLDSVEGRLATLDLEETAGRTRITEADEQLGRLNEKLRLYEVGLERRTGQANVVSVEIKNYGDRIEQAARELAASAKRSEEIDAEIAESERKSAAGEKRIAEIEKESAELSKKVSETEIRLEAFERISDEKRASELSSVEGLADIRAARGSLSAKQESTQDRINEVREAITKAEVRKTEYTRQITECRKQKNASAAFLDKKPQLEEELRADIDDLTRSEQKMNEDIIDCDKSLSNLQNNLEMYIALKNRFEGYRDSVRKLQLDAKQNRELGKRIVGAIADIVTTEKRYEVAIETAFGGAMQHLVVETAQDARYLIEYLKRTGGGIVTFDPIEIMRGRPDSREAERALQESGAIGLANNLVKYNSYYENVIKHFLSNTLVCDTIASATNIARKYPRAFQIVTLDGDIISASGSMTGGSRRKESGNLLANERNIKECEEAIARKKAALVKLKAALTSCTAELAEAQKKYEDFRVRVQEETANFAALSQKELALTDLIADAEADSEGYNSLLQRLVRQATALEGEANASAVNEDLLRKIRLEAANEAKTQSAQIEELRTGLDALEKQLHDLRVEKATLSTNRMAEADTVGRLRDEQDELRRKSDETRADVKRLERAVADLRQEGEKVALTEEEQRVVANLRKELTEVTESKRVLSERQEKLVEEKRELFARQQATIEERASAREQIARAETTLENMKQRLEENYGLTYESAQEFRDPGYDFSQSSTNINSLRHKIAALGPVNQNAEDDYNSLLERYNEMKTQREDLDKGIGDLNNVLTELRDTMQKQFDEGFNEINANFTQIFKELFGGGKAEMQLDYTDCDDPLDAGVEIVACPPGKKLAKISLLSGGEQAFTAIAILFAILKSHPMPFCILDEIEAALDEANVDRFARYLKKFSKETQFIVITHRKPTMAQADILFGVTMEEKGVSKIVSVKLSEVESRLGGDTVIA